MAQQVVRLLTDRIRHQLVIKVNGIITFDIAVEFRDEFLRRTSQINPSEYTLILDLLNQKPVSTEVINIFKGILLLYKEIPFKERFAIIMESPVARRQIMSIGKEDYIKEFNWVRSMEEIEGNSSTN